MKKGNMLTTIIKVLLAKPSWVMSHYIIVYKYGKRKRDYFGRFYFYSSFYFFFQKRSRCNECKPKRISRGRSSKKLDKVN